MLTVAIQPGAPKLSISRSGRVVVLLAGIWIAQAFDLYLTLTAHREGLLAEMNPLGAWALRYGSVGAIIFKLTLVGASSMLLLYCRNRRTTEFLVCLVLVVHIGLSFRWQEHSKICAIYNDPTVRQIAASYRQSDQIAAFPGNHHPRGLRPSGGMVAAAESR